MVSKGMPVIDADLSSNSNVTEFMQLGIGVSCRFALTSFEDVEMSETSRLSATRQAQFGAF